jgi:hypothetical protein
MAAHHKALRVERQDLFEDQLRASDMRSVRRASGLVLVRKPYLGITFSCQLLAKLLHKRRPLHAFVTLPLTQAMAC